jgi:hypothetical protein
MSAPKALQKRSASPILPLLVASVVTGIAAGYVLLVRQETIETDRLIAEAAHLESEVTRGRSWLASRSATSQEQSRVTETATEFAEKIPLGRRDVAIAQEWQRRAAELGLERFQYEVVGGLALPEDRAAQDRPAESRLATNPPQLRNVSIAIQFAGRYRETLDFLRFIAVSPWQVEIASMELQRARNGLSTEVRLTTRYFYE